MTSSRSLVTAATKTSLVGSMSSSSARRSSDSCSSETVLGDPLAAGHVVSHGRVQHDRLDRLVLDEQGDELTEQRLTLGRRGVEQQRETRADELVVVEDAADRDRWPCVVSWVGRDRVAPVGGRSLPHPRRANVHAP
jgi:hypothetical protein